MDVGRVASLYIRSVESFLAGNAIELTLTFEAPIDCGRLSVAFRQLVASNTPLRLRFEPGAWSPMAPAAVEAAVQEQIAGLTRSADPEEVCAEYHPTNAGLPIRIAILDERRLVLSLNHVFGNGKTALYYAEGLLRYYGNEPDESHSGDQEIAPSWPAWICRPAQVLTGVWWACAYLSLFAWRAGSSGAATTVDLSRGKTPEEPREGYAVWTYHLRSGETRSALERSATAGLTLTEHLCLVMADGLFDVQPEKSRVCISVPTDLTAYVPGSSRAAAGNFTGALIVQLSRYGVAGNSLDHQVRRAFSWAGRGVHYWVPWLMGQVGSEARLSNHFLRQARRPIPQRAPFENFSCAVSSVGVVQGEMARKYLTRVSAYTRTQTIMLCAITLNGRMSIEVSMARDLFDRAEVTGLTDRAVARLTGMSLEEAAGRRVELCRGGSRPRPDSTASPSCLARTSSA